MIEKFHPWQNPEDWTDVSVSKEFRKCGRFAATVPLMQKGAFEPVIIICLDLAEHLS